MFEMLHNLKSVKVKTLENIGMPAVDEKQ